MNRRDAIQKVLTGAAAVFALTRLLPEGRAESHMLVPTQEISLAEAKRRWPEEYVVQVLDHYGEDYRYQPYKTFPSQAEAEAWVLGLMPQLLWIGIRPDHVEVDEMVVCITSGGAPPMGTEDPNALEFIEYGLNRQGVFYSVEDAWMFLAGLRINSQPVNWKKSRSISPLITLPFYRGTPVIETLTGGWGQGRTKAADLIYHRIRTGYRNAVRAQFKVRESDYKLWDMEV